jgi:DNA-binding transcriptional LysR family regulator
MSPERRYFQYRLVFGMISQADRSEMGVTLDQLRIFVAVAERQHVTHAAEALNLAQSAASHAIASLEDRHKTKLFNRIGRHIELTDAGQAFLKEVRCSLLLRRLS